MRPVRLFQAAKHPVPTDYMSLFPPRRSGTHTLHVSGLHSTSAPPRRSLRNEPSQPHAFCGHLSPQDSVLPDKVEYRDDTVQRSSACLCRLSPPQLCDGTPQETQAACCYVL